MNKHVWIGVTAVVAVLLFVMWMYFTLIVDHTPPPEKLKKVANTTISQTQTPSPSPVVAVVKSPFNVSAYEVNYTFVFTVSLDDITMTMEGWMVVGSGPAGNYSFGMLAVPLQGTATFKLATEGNTTYTLSCIHGDCTVNEEEWPFTGLIEGVNVTRAIKGQCRQLNYTGTLYEERGMIDPKAFSRFIEGLSGNYTAYICEVNGVMLSADLTATASAHGEMMHITLKMEAMKAGPYSVDAYNRILREVKSKK
jgi:hypothetical protein